jgi:ADP-heptose:LPS heptosyltransferase
MRILVVKRDKLGDMLLTTPVLAHLAAARPDAELHLLANDYNAWVVEGHPALARVWVYPRVRHGGRVRLGAALAHLPLAWQLARARFDVAIAMGGDESPRAIRRALATRARRVVGYAAAPAGYGARFTDPLPPPAAGHEVERMLALLAPLGVAPPATIAPPAWTASAPTVARARGWLAERGLAPDGFVLLGLNARFACKQPDPAQVARWTTHWHATWGLATVLVWTPGRRDDRHYPGDDELAARVLAQPLPFVQPHVGSFDDTLGLAALARTSVVPDSGLMHFAAASPGGVLGLFADPAHAGAASRWAPLGPRAVFLEAPRAVAELADDDVHAALAPLATAPGPARVLR